MRWQIASIHSSQKFKAFGFSTYKELRIKSLRINTSKTKEFKLPAMNTYEKVCGRGPAPCCLPNPPRSTFSSYKGFSPRTFTCRMSFAGDKGAMLLRGN